MARQLDVKDGVLGFIVESFEPVAEKGKELEQLQAAVDDAQDNYDQAAENLLATEVDPEKLVAAAEAVSEARSALEDTKSELQDGLELVGEPADQAGDGATNDDGGVPVGVTVANDSQEF